LHGAKKIRIMKSMSSLQSLLPFVFASATLVFALLLGRLLLRPARR
jgi:hypothetical protein